MLQERAIIVENELLKAKLSEATLALKERDCRLEEQSNKLEEQSNKLEEQSNKLEEQSTELSQLKAQLAWLKQQLFGTGRSEKLDPNQLELDLGPLEALEQKIEELEKVQSHNRKKAVTKVSSDERYSDLPIEEEIEVLPQEVQADPEAYKRTAAFDESIEVDYTPPRFFRRRYIYPKFRRVDDPGEALLRAPSPARVVEGLPSANVLALITVGKYMDHLPLFRQAKQYQRLGCPFSADSMVRWIEKIALWLKPIYDYIGDDLLGSNYLQADETPVTFCDPDLGIKKSKKGYFCVYSKPGGHVLFVWRLSRSAESVTGFIENYEGLLQTDAYAPYITLAKSKEQITLLGCMAHARRKFKEAFQYQRQEAGLVLTHIKNLYRIEAEIRESNPKLSPENTLQKRSNEAKPILEALKRILIDLSTKGRPKDPLRKATAYALNNWEYLTEYTKHPEAQIDNNLIENKIRPTAIGKKNWLFIGHSKAGDRAAIIYSIIISCQNYGINPQEYLKAVFSKDTKNRTPQQLAEMTPQAFARQIEQKTLLAT